MLANMNNMLGRVADKLVHGLHVPLWTINMACGRKNSLLKCQYNLYVVCMVYSSDGPLGLQTVDHCFINKTVIMKVYLRFDKDLLKYVCIL